MTRHKKPPDQGSVSTYAIMIAGADLNFRQLLFDDDRVEIDQILREGDFNPTLDFRSVELTFPGTRGLDDDETINLDRPEPPHLLVGKSDRTFAIAIDDIVHELPFDEMGEPQLRKIGVVADDKVLFLAREGEPDRELEPDDIVSFAGAEVERLFTREATVTVCVDDEGERELPRGSYVFKKIVALLGIPAGYILSYINAAGKLVPFREGERVELFDGIKFLSHAAGGGAS